MVNILHVQEIYQKSYSQKPKWSTTLEKKPENSPTINVHQLAKLDYLCKFVYLH